MSGRTLICLSRWVSILQTIGVVSVVVLCLGTVTQPGLWAATYYVDDDTGNDGRSAAEAQSPTTPWKTITRAVAEPTLVPWDVISVAEGTYDATLGENFPLALVDGVAIQGADPPTTTISGPGASVLIRNANTPLASGTTLSGFTLTHDAAVSANVAMSFTLASVAMAPEILGNAFQGLAGEDRGIKITDSGNGARAFTGTIENNSFNDLFKAVQAEFSSNGRPADLSPEIRANSFDGNDFGVEIFLQSSYEGTSSPVIVDNDINGSQLVDIYMEFDIGGGHGATMTPLISGNTLTGSARYGVRLSISTVTLASTIDVATFSPTIVNNTITNANYQAILLDYYFPEDCTLVSDVTVAGNTITNSGDVGIDIEASSATSTATVDFDLTIANNTITSSDGGIEIEFSDSISDVVGSIDITVAGNTISEPSGIGIFLSMSSFYNATPSLSVTVQGNTVTDSTSTGIDLSVGYQTSFIASRVDVLDNVVDSGGGRGLDLEIEDLPSPISYVQVACNTTVDNVLDGLYLDRDFYAPNPDFGGGDLASAGLNTLMNNGGYDFYNNDPDAVDAHSNWWGTTDGTTIDAHIFDDDEDPTRGAVEFSGWLSGPPTVSATATLDDAVQIDLSPVGLSSGDTIRFTATLTGTGACGCASALFRVPMPDNGVFVPGSLTANRGIFINEEFSTRHPELIVGLGALEASETVTIAWDVVAGDGCGMSNQAVLTCHQLGDVLTDDPDVAGGADPTFVSLGIFCDDFESGDALEWSNTVP